MKHAEQPCGGSKDNCEVVHKIGFMGIFIPKVAQAHRSLTHRLLFSLNP